LLDSDYVNNISFFLQNADI